MSKHRKNNPLPGFGITLGFTVFYLSLVAIVPLSMLFFKTAGLGWDGFWKVILAKRTVAALSLSFTASLASALANAVFGFLTAWALVRYPFPFKKFFDALIDWPFALPTAVTGISLTSLYAPNGWIGSALEKIGFKVSFTPFGIALALTFIGFPFVVRTLQPVLEDLDKDMEEAAWSLGASRWQVFKRVIFPSLFPALCTGIALSFARALGEYGSVVFIAGNMPYKTEIVPLLIMTKLEQYDYTGATAIACFMLIVSFILLFTINSLQAWSRRFK